METGAENRVFDETPDLQASQTWICGDGFSCENFSTAKACMLTEQHREFVRCGVDSEVVTAAEGDFLFGLVSQVLDMSLELSGMGESRVGAKVVKIRRAAPWLRNSQFGRSFSRAGCYANTTRPCFGPHLNFVPELLLGRNVLPPLSKREGAGVLKQAVLGRSPSSFEAQMQPTKDVYSRVHGLVRKGRKRPACSLDFWHKRSEEVILQVTNVGGPLRNPQVTKEYGDKCMEMTAALFCR